MVVRLPSVALYAMTCVLYESALLTVGVIFVQPLFQVFCFVVPFLSTQLSTSKGFHSCLSFVHKTHSLGVSWVLLLDASSWAV